MTRAGTHAGRRRPGRYPRAAPVQFRTTRPSRAKIPRSSWIGAFRRDFERNGPSIYRICRTTLDGWLRYKNDPDPRVRARFAWEARSLKDGYAAALVGHGKAPAPHQSGGQRAGSAQLRHGSGPRVRPGEPRGDALLGPVLLWSARRGKSAACRPARRTSRRPSSSAATGPCRRPWIAPFPRSPNWSHRAIRATDDINRSSVPLLTYRDAPASQAGAILRIPGARRRLEDRNPRRLHHLHDDGVHRLRQPGHPARNRHASRRRDRRHLPLRRSRQFPDGRLARYPIALAPGMGLNAYFTYAVVKGMGSPLAGRAGRRLPLRRGVPRADSAGRAPADPLRHSTRALRRRGRRRGPLHRLHRLSQFRHHRAQSRRPPSRWATSATKALPSRFSDSC